ncbi:MAG: P-loop NTPase [Thermodesulfobacteriota bacterium]
MKIMVMGKGGSGKSTLAALLAEAFSEAGKDVLLVDADESNFGLGLLLGMQAGKPLMDFLGGRPGVREKLKQAGPLAGPVPIFSAKIAPADIPAECAVKKDGIRLVSVGKIRDFGEGCACMVGVLAKKLLGNLALGENDVVVVDSEAGVEHFGRGVDAEADVLLGVLDPTRESLLMAGAMDAMARKINAKLFFVLNKAEPLVHKLFTETISEEKIAAVVGPKPDLALDALAGRPLSSLPEEVRSLAAFLIGQ